MSTLSNSVFNFLYSIPNLNNDLEMINSFTIAFIVVTIINTVRSIKSPVAYGRHATNSSASATQWIPTIKSRTAWTVSFAPVVLIALLLIFSTPSEKLRNPLNLLAFISFVVHYTNRFLYSLKISQNAKPVSVFFLLQLVGSASLNSFAQCHDLANVHESTPSSLAYFGVLFVIIGLAVNIHHDNLLLNLRKPNSIAKTKVSNEKTIYKIPVGGLFTYISCANYFGEIVEWCGYALISRGALQIAFAAFSAAFLGVRALQHHEFYTRTFSTKYPPNRKAIIPFIL